MGALTAAGAALLVAASAAPALDAAPHPSAPRHAELRVSTPADGDTLYGGPVAFRLEFTEPIEPALARLVLILSDGERLEIEPRGDPRDVHAILARAPDLDSGGYRLAWRIVSADGHPVTGSVVFYVAGPHGAAGAAPPDPDVFAAGGSMTGREPATGAGLLRGAASAALLALAGVLMIRGAAPNQRFRALIGLAAASTALLAIDALVWAGHATGLSTGQALAAAAGSLTGRLTMARLAAAALALWALALARRTGLAAVFAGAALLAGAGIGHSAAVAPAVAVPAKAVHLLLAAVWLGGLIQLARGVVSAAVVPAPADLERYRNDAARVSRWALIAVAGLALTGVVQVALLLPSPSSLLTSRYGLFGIGKAAGLAVLAGFGARNRLRLLPALAAGGDGSALRRSVVAEIVVFAGVVLLAGLLASTPPPG